MTIVFLQPDGVPITAQAARQGSAALYGGGSGKSLGGRSGFRVGTAANALTATSTTWTLKPCAAMIDPGASTVQGMYGWASDGNISGPVTAADATYARTDIVYIQINDATSGDGSGEVTANVKYLAGDPLPTPVAKDLPPRSFLVGTISVPKATTGSPTATLNPARFAAAGAALPATLAERDALAPYPTLTVSRTDLGGLHETWDGNAWTRGISHAEFTGSQSYTGALWGPGILTKVGAQSPNSPGIVSPERDLITLPGPGLYAINWRGKLGANVGATNTYARLMNESESIEYASADIPTGYSAFNLSLPNFYVPATQNMRLRMNSGSGHVLSSTVRISRIG